MPFQKIPGQDNLGYYLLSFSPSGLERKDDPDAPQGLLSERINKIIASRSVTDVFLLAHGWKGDVPAAISQYNSWIAAMADCEEDRRRIQERRPDFNALVIGLHWPSLPWGSEQMNQQSTSFSQDERSYREEFINSYAQRIADTAPARAALAVIHDSAIENVAPLQLPVEVRDAYFVLDRESGLGSEGEGSAPGSDREAFNPLLAYQNATLDPANFSEFSLDGILSPLRQLSFWKMKDRARRVGEMGGRQLLRSLQRVAFESGCKVRFHVMGHSFGCILASSMLGGEKEAMVTSDPVDSFFLVQGAMSLWSFCDSIPSHPGSSGYFRSIIDDNKVKGPILVTLSEFDTAVGNYYPLGAGIRRQVTYDVGDFPKYGGLGTFGVRGSGLAIEDREMLELGEMYEFDRGKIYNISAGSYISRIDGAAGAHNDIAHPEIAHAFWEAVLLS